jgi:hypothetical protein
MYLELLTVYYFFIAVLLFLNNKQEIPYIDILQRFRLEVCLINIVLFFLLFYRYIENYAVCMLLSIMTMSLMYILHSLKFTESLKKIGNF